MRSSDTTSVTSVEALLELPYFELLSYLGSFPLHVGGIRATQELLDAAQVRTGERILEIGCGLGYSTRVLIAAGANVSVVDKSRRMLAAARRHCARNGLAEPTGFCTSAERLDGVPVQVYDFVLYECVLGFVQEKRKAIEQCLARCGTESRIGVIDYHYVQLPSRSVRGELSKIFGCELSPATERDWEHMFYPFELDYWRSYPVSDPDVPTAEAIAASVRQAEISFESIGCSVEMVAARVADRWKKWERVFSRNRALLRSHIAVFRSSERALRYIS